MVVTSELTVAEIIDKPLRESNQRLLTFYEGFLRSTDSLEVVAVSRSILLKAAELRAGGLCAKLPDAIHVATAAEAGCGALVTDDDRMRVPSPMKKVGYVEQDLLAILSSSA
jgi:predicted nucleic acid-binding protein